MCCHHTCLHAHKPQARDSLMIPLLDRYVATTRCAQPSPSISVPPALARALYVNGQWVDHGTATDGNCGVHAFGISLYAAGSKSKQLKATSAYKRFVTSRVSNTSITHLRNAGHGWMACSGDVVVWSGMSFKDLALTMSSHEENYRGHLERMARDREWVDASFIHALGVVFHVDVQIWQEHMEPAIVGHSLMVSDSPTEPHALLNMAMVNDLHFWGVCPIPQPELRPPDDRHHCKHIGRDLYALDHFLCKPQKPHIHGQVKTFLDLQPVLPEHVTYFRIIFVVCFPSWFHDLHVCMACITALWQSYHNLKISTVNNTHDVV